MNKPFLASKLNWLGILMLVAGLGAYANMLPANLEKWVLMLAGVAGVILRTFFTGTNPDGSPK